MNNYFIIGSRWMKDLFPNSERIQKRCKSTADFDILLEYEPDRYISRYFKELYGTKTEFHVIPKLWYALTNSQFNHGDILFTLKASHIPFHKKHIEKTIYDCYLMSAEKCTIIKPLFFELYDFWVEKFGEPWRADFTAESAQFFDDAVSRENVHDELHIRVSDPELGQPAFRFLQDPGQTTVWVCPTKFNETTEYIRKRVIIEEAMTLALERDILSKSDINPQISYQKWVSALCERLAPLWMVPYIVENLHEFMTYRPKF